MELGGCEWLNIENCPALMQLSLIECLGSPPEWDAEVSVCDWSASKLWLREDWRVDICRPTGAPGRLYLPAVLGEKQRQRKIRYLLRGAEEEMGGGAAQYGKTRRRATGGQRGGRLSPLTLTDQHRS